MELTKRQAEIAEYVAKGFPDKAIAVCLGLSVKTVAEHVRETAAKLPGETRPRHRITLWFFNLKTD